MSEVDLVSQLIATTKFKVSCGEYSVQGREYYYIVTTPTGESIFEGPMDAAKFFTLSTEKNIKVAPAKESGGWEFAYATGGIDGMNKFGKDGWEAVSVTPMGTLMKRRLP